MLAYVSRILLNNGFETLTAPDGQAALELLLSIAALPDLIISECVAGSLFYYFLLTRPFVSIMMPRLDGKGLVAALRQNDATKNLPVIMLSARAGEEERSDGLSAGADGMNLLSERCLAHLSKITSSNHSLVESYSPVLMHV